MIIEDIKNLKMSYIDTPLGQMVAISDDNALYLLEFVDNSNLEFKVKQIVNKTKSNLVLEDSEPINLIRTELNQYFAGTLKEFKTPIVLLGTEFQKTVWQELKEVPYGQTRSYANIATLIKRPSAFRAVAQANSSNYMPIIIPCHRIINSNGKLCGYSGGIAHKKWLLVHESK